MASPCAARQATDLAWNAGFVGAVLLGPLHSLATDGRGLGGLVDWLAWVDGLTSVSSLLMLGAFTTTALVRRVPRAVLVVLTVPVLGLLGGAAATWPQAEAPAAAVAAEEASDPSSGSADLGDAGTAELTVTPGSGREVTLEVQLLTPDGSPFVPFASPSVTLESDVLSLGETELTEVGVGSYTATMNVPLDGDWSAQISVRTTEFDNPVAVIPFNVG